MGIKFMTFVTTSNKENLGKPRLMKSFIPDWYKNAESSFVESTSGRESDSGLKKCIPYLDALLTGYTLVLPVDVYVYKNEDGTLNVRWNGPDDHRDIIETRPKEQGETIPRLPGHHWQMLTYVSKWGFKTPRGYSTLVTHPLNRWDLPFSVTSGIMDTDRFFANGSIPFFIKEDFEGVIPAGTPIAQLIPIKRNTWKSAYNNGLDSDMKFQGSEARLPDKNYKKKYWIRKKYE